MIIRIYHTVTKIYRKNIHTKISVPYAFKVDIKKRHMIDLPKHIPISERL